jgi:hypothetical protein
VCPSGHTLFYYTAEGNSRKGESLALSIRDRALPTQKCAKLTAAAV